MDGENFGYRLYRLTPRAWVTTTLIGVNVLVWIGTVLLGASPVSPSALELLALGGNHLPLTLQQPWRLMSATVLHAGIIHLAFNMWALRETGRIAERFYGNLQFLAIYLMSGLFASLASLFFSARQGVSVGASGAVFGVVGCLLAALSTKAHKLPPGLAAPMRASMLAFVGYSLFMGFVAGFIDNAAHIGGLVTGFLMGLVMAEKFDREEYLRQAPIRAAAAISAGLVGAFFVWNLLLPGLQPA